MQEGNSGLLFSGCLVYPCDILGDSMTTDQKLKPFLVRLRPETRLLLDDAAQAQRRSRASLVDQAIVEMLAGRFARVENRLDQMLGTK